MIVLDISKKDLYSSLDDYMISNVDDYKLENVKEESD